MTTHGSCARTNATNMRLHEHMRNIGIEHFRIALIEMFPCDNIEQLRAREGQHIRGLRPALNKIIAGRTMKEYNEVYYNQNRAAKIERQRKYDERNRDRLHQVNECECGGRYTTNGKSHHFKTQMHQNYVAKLPNPAE